MPRSGSPATTPAMPARFVPMEVGRADADQPRERLTFSDRVMTVDRRWAWAVALAAVLAAAAAAAAVAMAQSGRPSSPAPDKQPQAISLLTLGDWGRRGVLEQTRVAEGMLLEAAAVRGTAPVVAVLSTGDQFYDNGVSSASDRDDDQWQESWRHVYYPSPSRGPLWDADFVGALGNHDLRGNVEAQVERHSCTRPAWTMPGRYFQYKACIPGAPGLAPASFPSPGCHGAAAGNGTAATRSQRLRGAQVHHGCVCVAVIDTTPLLKAMRELPGPQWARLRGNCASLDRIAMIHWLNETLRGFAHGGCARSLVVGHHPIVSGGEHGGNPEVGAAILGAMSGVASVYLSGHDHMQQVSAIPLEAAAPAPPLQVVSGSGSTVRRDSVPANTSLWTSASPGFGRLTLRKVGPTWLPESFDATLTLFDVDPKSDPGTPGRIGWTSSIP